MKRPIHATGDRQLLIRWLHLYLAACFVYPGWYVDQKEIENTIILIPAFFNYVVNRNCQLAYGIYSHTNAL
ncbi:hypothetical protein FB446DRAFT_721559 [Lentinula raphanica]|nr:hypothetical protein FB446DRAFT_721559 [Lentinula raphanica]